MVKALNILSGRWKPIILHILSENDTVRFGALRKLIPPVSQKMLTQQLRELEANGIVHREVYPEVPPRVDYSLTEKGKTLIPVLNGLYDWGKTI